MTQRHRLAALLTLPVIAGIAIAVIPHVQALDYELHQTIVDPNAPTDVCPNIGGVQTSLPSGMQLDSNGNCYTPTPIDPVVPPVATDLCSNIPEMQITLPSGYYRKSNGQCFTQPVRPAEPVDVCPNLEDVQILIPEGYYLDADNQCHELPARKDVCLNIDGPQETVPEGMVLENDSCFTPENAQPTTPPDSSGSGIANVPSVLEPFVKPLINLVPESAQSWLKSLPPVIARTAPYYIFSLVGLLALGVLLQSLREAEFVTQLAALLKRERDIAEQKGSFIALASHYLRTPLTLMQSGLDTLVASQEVTSEEAAPLANSLGALQEKVAVILSNIEHNTALSGIEAPPSKNVQKLSVLRSPFFWVALIGSLLLSALANFLFAIVGNQAIGAVNFIFQIVFAIAMLVLLYMTIRNLYLKRRLHDENTQLIAHEKAIDEARNGFITQTTIALKESLVEIDTTRQPLKDKPSALYINNGYDRFNGMLERFLLLSQIQTGAERVLERIDIQQAVNDAIVRQQSAITAKQLTVTNTVGQVFANQNPQLFGFVIDSLLDNAVKFNELGGTITISASPDSQALRLTVADNGIGIDSAKLGQLFQPFSRATSTMEFNYEGLGFSLFLDKIILDYTGGSITAASELKRGTNLTVSTPLNA